MDIEVTEIGENAAPTRLGRRALLGLKLAALRRLESPDDPGLLDSGLVAARLNARAPQPIADRPVILIDAQHHARELVSAQVALYNVWRLVDGYGKDPVATRILDTRVVHVIPSVNVDGNALVLADNQNNRKTLSPACWST